MPHFSKQRFDRPSFGKKPFGPRQMFKAHCAECGNACEVPFKPNGTKPVLCNNCFGKEEGPRGPRHDFGPRPPHHHDHHDRPAPRPDQAFNDLKAELRGVNERLERLISLLTPAPRAAKAPKKKVSKKE